MWLFLIKGKGNLSETSPDPPVSPVSVFFFFLRELFVCLFLSLYLSRADSMINPEWHVSRSLKRMNYSYYYQLTNFIISGGDGDRKTRWGLTAAFIPRYLEFREQVIPNVFNTHAHSETVDFSTIKNKAAASCHVFNWLLFFHEDLHRKIMPGEKKQQHERKSPTAVKYESQFRASSTYTKSWVLNSLNLCQKCGVEIIGDNN